MNTESARPIGVIELPEIGEFLRPEHTALLVVDMQIGFIGSEGTLGKQIPQLYDRFEPTVSRIREMVDACRTMGLPVVWIRTENDPWRMDGPMLFNQARRREGLDGTICKPGSTDCALVDGLAEIVDPLDPIITKINSFDGFRGTDDQGNTLDAILKNHGIKTLLISGATTEACVMITANSAKDAGYATILLTDAVQSTDDNRQALGQAIIGRLIATQEMTVRETIDQLSTWKA